MLFFRNVKHELDYKELHPSDSVQAISEKLLHYLKLNPLNCHSCKNSCCSIFPIRPDNVFMKWPSFFAAEKQKCRGNWLLKEAVELENRNYGMPKKELTNNHYLCRYGSVGKCDIYSNRPILCHLYTCGAVSTKWKELMNVIVDAYKDALEYEIMEQTIKAHGSRGKLPSNPGDAANPCLYARDYSVQIGMLVHG